MSPNIQFYFVITGSEEPHCCGMKAFIEACDGVFDKNNTYFINFECLGGGKLKYTSKEGFIVLQRHHHTLIQICEAISHEPGIDFKSCFTVAHSDSIVPLVNGYKSIGLIAVDEHFVPTNYHTKSDTEDRIDYNLLEKAQEIAFKMVDYLIKFKEMRLI